MQDKTRLQESSLAVEVVHAQIEICCSSENPFSFPTTIYLSKFSSFFFRTFSNALSPTKIRFTMLCHDL